MPPNPAPNFRMPSESAIVSAAIRRPQDSGIRNPELMILSGLWSFLVGLVAIIRQSFYVTLPNYTYQFSVHGWGWIHLALGIVIFAAGFCVLLGQRWALLTGIVLAVFSAVANFMFLPYYPLWAIIVIAIDLFVIWALATGISRHSEAA